MQTLDAQEAIKQIAVLKSLIRESDVAYYVKHQPYLTDYSYDKLVGELKELEAAFPNLITQDSPTQRVGEMLNGDLGVFTHKVPMLSIDNVYNTIQFTDWYNKASSYPIFIQWKVDGLAVALHYEDGWLVRAVTRGDGKIGEDVTANVRAMRSVPLYLGDGDGTSIEIRGEVFIRNSTFKRLIDSGFEAKTARNLAAGTLKSVEGGPQKVIDRGLEFIAHGVAGYTGNKSLTKTYEALERMDVPVLRYSKTISTLAEATEFIDSYEKAIPTIDLPVDGVVIKVDQFDHQDQLGSGHKFVKWAVAYKYKPTAVTTTLLGIEWQVGKIGYVTPRARLKPVDIGGTTVSSASVHNPGAVMALGLYDGCEVEVVRAGEVIPQITRVVNKVPNPVLGSCAIPAEINGAKTSMDGAKLSVSDPRAQLVQQIIYWCGKGQMDINGVGKHFVKDVVGNGIVRSVADLYRFNDPAIRDRLTSLPRFGERKVAKIWDELDKSRHNGMARVLCSFGWHLIGHQVSEKLAGLYPDIWALLEVQEHEFRAMDGIGPTIASALFNTLHSEDNIKLLKELESLGVDLKRKVVAMPQLVTSGRLTEFQGYHICVTGKFERGTRGDIHHMVLQAGGMPVDTVTKNCHMLLVGDKAGSKLDKAQNLGIRIMYENEFYTLMEKNGII